MDLKRRFGALGLWWLNHNASPACHADRRPQVLPTYCTECLREQTLRGELAHLCAKWAPALVLLARLPGAGHDVCAPGLDPHLQGRGLASATLALSYLLCPGFRMAHASMWSRSGVYFWAAGWKRRYQLPNKDVISPDELLSALKRYVEESGEIEQTVASKIGMNHHTLHRWLSDNESPKKGEGKLALTALFLRRAGYL